MNPVLLAVLLFAAPARADNISFPTPPAPPQVPTLSASPVPAVQPPDQSNAPRPVDAAGKHNFAIRGVTAQGKTK